MTVDSLTQSHASGQPPGPSIRIVRPSQRSTDTEVTQAAVQTFPTIAAAALLEISQGVESEAKD
jgi:hypothetical protein